MLGNDPNLALSVLYGWGRWEAGRSRGGGGHGPAAQGLGESGGGGRGEEVEQQHQHQQQQQHQRGEDSPPKAPNNRRSPGTS